MRGSQIAVALVVVSLLVPTSVVASVNGSPEFKVSVPNEKLTPDESTDLTVKLTNQGQLQVSSTRNPSLNNEVTTARGVEVELKSNGAPIKVRDNAQTKAQIAKGTSAPFDFGVTVAEDAEPGTYEMEVVVEYKHAMTVGELEGGVNEKTTKRHFDVEVEIEDRARFEIVDTETNVRVGSSGTVDMTMENVGTEAASDTTVAMQSPNGDLTFGNGASSATRYKGTWRPGEQKTVSYQVRASEDAKEQSYAFTATTEFEDTDGVNYQSDPLKLGVTPLPEMEFSLSNVSSDLQVGEERTLRGTVTNDGETVARDVVMRLTTENENVNPTEREYSVGNLEPGESANFDFAVEISDGAESGPRQFSFVAEYRDSDDEIRKSDSLTTRQKVGEKTDTFDVDVKKGSLSNGQTANLEVVVTNTASETMTDISAKLFADDPISAGDSEAYIDELQPGNSTTISFTVSASGAIAKDYPVSMDFQYDDEDGDTFVSDTYREPVTVTEKQGGGSGGFPLVIVGIGVAAVVGIGGYFRFR